MYQKYRDRFEIVDELGNIRFGNFLLSEVLKKMVKTCAQCQRDRMRCTLRPLCPDRIFLNILITLGAKTVDLPSFCYQVHNRALQAYLKSGAERVHPAEPRYPLRYFRKFVTLKKGESEGTFRAFKEYLEKSTQKPVHCHALKDSWFFSVGKGIFIVDLKRQLVSLDPDGDKVQRAALEPLIKFLAEIHGIMFTLLKDMADTWYLRVDIVNFPEDKFSEIVSPRLKALEEHWAYVQIQKSKNLTQILIGLDPPPGHTIRLKNLRETMKIFAEIIQAAPKEKARTAIRAEGSTPKLEPAAKAE